MKKLLALAMSVFVAFTIVMAQPKNTDKALWKNAQKKAKELARDGWKVDGSKTLEVYLYEHYIALRDNKDN